MTTVLWKLCREKMCSGNCVVETLLWKLCRGNCAVEECAVETVSWKLCRGNVPWKLCCGNCAVETVPWKMCRGNCAVETVPWKMCRGKCAVETVLWKLCRGNCAVENVPWKLCRGNCVVDIDFFLWNKKATLICHDLHLINDCLASMASRTDCLTRDVIFSLFPDNYKIFIITRERINGISPKSVKDESCNYDLNCTVGNVLWQLRCGNCEHNPKKS